MKMLLRIPRRGAPIRRSLGAVLMVGSVVVCSTAPRALVAQGPRVDRLGGLQNVAGAPDTIENCELAATDQATVTNMTLEYMVELALKSSYRVRNVNLSIDRTQLNVRAQRARLRSRVDLDLTAPDVRSVSQNLWNSYDQRYDIVHENSQRMEAQLAIRQPIILFGFPTNGYLSLNNQVYRYAQTDERGRRNLRFYNRSFVRLTQPLFQPNALKNDIEKAQLDLEDAELGFYADVVNIVGDVSRDYFGLFRIAYGEQVAQARVSNLEQAVAVADSLAASGGSRADTRGQMQVELANAREQLQQSRSQFRLSATRLRTRLNIKSNDSIGLSPTMEIAAVPIDEQRAVQLAFELTPRMRQLAIDRRNNQINVDQTKGRGGVQVDLSMSYGREMRDSVFGELFKRPSNSYTVGVTGKIPIWDWGERDARIEASRVSLRQTELRIEEAEVNIRADVQSEVRNVSEFQNRATAMQENFALASGLSRESLDRFRRDEVSALELLQTFQRESDTARNLLDAYLGWRGSISSLQQLTFYDFEVGVPVLERFGITLDGAK